MVTKDCQLVHRFQSFTVLTHQFPKKAGNMTCESLYAGKSIAIHVHLPNSYSRQMHTEFSHLPRILNLQSQRFFSEPLYLLVSYPDLTLCTPLSHTQTSPSVPPSLIPRPHPLYPPVSHPDLTLCTPLSHTQTSPSVPPCLIPRPHPLYPLVSYPDLTLCTPLSHTQTSPSVPPCLIPRPHPLYPLVSHPDLTLVRGK